MQSMDDLFYAFLQDAYFAEKELLKFFPTLVVKSANETLKLAIRDHQDETAEQVARLDQVFEIIGKEPQGSSARTMAAIIAQAQQIIDEIDHEAVRDAGILAALRAAGHLEIARYSTLLGWAEHLGEDEIVELLSASLDEEQHAEELLSSIAEGGLNATASERPEVMEV